MKFSTTLLAAAIAAGAVSAVALPEADPGCWHPGQPCAVKARAAEAEAGCWHPGQPCAKAKRAADAFAEALAEAAPAEEFLDARCDLAECFQARRAARSVASIVAMTRDVPDEYIRSLNLEDEEKLKRDAEAMPGCWHPGQPCSKAKRFVEPEQKREAGCWHPGQPCAKLRRAAEALAEASANPSAVAGCWHPGQPCAVKAREAEAGCWHPGQPCSKAIRDLSAMQNAARDVLQSL